MFDDRRLGWKLAAALGTVLLLAAWAGFLGRSVNPALRYCLSKPEAWDGTEVRLAGPVLDGTDEGFVLRSPDGLRVRVRSTEHPSPGTHVEVAGTFRADGPRLDADRLRMLPSTDRRWLVETVSIAVLLLLLLNFRRRFSFHPDALQARRRDAWPTS